MKAPISLSGIPIITNPFMEPGGEYGYVDWRERLNRNLSRPSTGKWEPLTYIREPAIVLIRGNLLCHPNTLAKLKAAWIDTSEWRGVYGI